MTARAARIFVGRCASVTDAEDSVAGGPVQFVTFTVAQSLKGPAGDTVTVKLAGRAGASGARQGEEFAGAPVFRAGEQVVLFLYGESRFGFSHAVGLGQGKFTVISDGKGGRVAVNAFGNDGLFHNLTDAASTELGPELARLKKQRAIDVEALVAVVEKLRDAATRKKNPADRTARRGGRP